MIKDETSIQDMLESCEAGGGAGAVIFDANTNRGIDSWSVRQINIPAVAVRLGLGSELMQKIGETVTIGDLGNDDIEYTYTTLSGTSQATPHVSAAAALLWSHFGDCTNHQIRYAMDRTAVSPDGVCNDSYGYGIVKVHDAYDWLLQNHCTGWDVPQTSQGGCTTI
jgi:subtilisin family serine protease